MSGGRRRDRSPLQRAVERAVGRVGRVGRRGTAARVGGPSRASTAASSSRRTQSASWRWVTQPRITLSTTWPSVLITAARSRYLVVADGVLDHRRERAGARPSRLRRSRIERVHRPHQGPRLRFVDHQRLGERTHHPTDPVGCGRAGRRTGAQPLAEPLQAAEVRFSDELILRSTELVDGRHRHPTGLGEIAHRHRVVAATCGHPSGLHQPLIPRIGLPRREPLIGLLVSGCHRRPSVADPTSHEPPADLPPTVRRPVANGSVFVHSID